jgi:hypothetical protein
VLALLAWRWSALLTATLSEDLAHAAGLSPGRERLVLTLALAVVVAVALKVVGALLIAAMLIVPAAAARSVARTPEAMAALAVAIGALAVLGGLRASLIWDTPAGPSIVAVAAVVGVHALYDGLQLDPGLGLAPVGQVARHFGGDIGGYFLEHVQEPDLPAGIDELQRPFQKALAQLSVADVHCNDDGLVHAGSPAVRSVPCRPIALSCRPCATLIWRKPFMQPKKGAPPTPLCDFSDPAVSSCNTSGTRWGAGCARNCTPLPTSARCRRRSGRG